jgi:hypothetical protein
MIAVHSTANRTSCGLSVSVQAHVAQRREARSAGRNQNRQLMRGGRA